MPGLSIYLKKPDHVAFEEKCKKENIKPSARVVQLVLKDLGRDVPSASVPENKPAQS